MRVERGCYLDSLGILIDGIERIDKSQFIILPSGKCNRDCWLKDEITESCFVRGIIRVFGVCE